MVNAGAKALVRTRRNRGTVMAIRVAAVVVAAGRGTRAGLDYPKQYKVLGGSPMVRESLRVFAEPPRGRSRAAGDPSRRCRPLRGRRRRPRARASRCPARRRGRARCAPGSKRSAGEAPAIVLVHDAARPFTSAALVSRAIAAARASGAAIPALPVTDTVKLVDDAGAGRRDARPLARCAPCRRRRRSPTLPCSTRIAAPPPQAATDFPDDAALVEWAGLKVAVFEGEAGNVKMTTPDDFARAERDAQAALDRYPHRHRLRHPCVRSRRRSCLARRREDPACAQARRPLRRRRRAACADRRDPRRARRRRHRRAFSAERRAMARRLVRPVPRLRGRAREARAAAQSAISTSRSSARRRRSIRTATRCARASPRSPAFRSTASA